MDDLLRAEQALYAAMLARDYTALEALMSPDLVYVHSTGVAETRDGYFAGVRRGLYEYEKIASRNTRIRMLGDTALMDGICDMYVGAHDRAADWISLLTILVWTKQEGRWQLLHRHATRIPR